MAGFTKHDVGHHVKEEKVVGQCSLKERINTYLAAFARRTLNLTLGKETFLKK
jgi:hypothetical protein